MSNVTVQIPQEALVLAGLDNQSDSERASLLVALELFREERVSLGRAAELAGLGIEAFMEFSAKRQVPLHYAADDLSDDHNTAVRLKL
jgi:predicted HTH domain antitoxin